MYVTRRIVFSPARRCSPPPCGEGLGVGVGHGRRACWFTPPLARSPSRGGEFGRHFCKSEATTIEAPMSYIAKPSAHHPALPKNALGLTRRDYEGTMSTLCAGCGHNFDHGRHHRSRASRWTCRRTASPRCRASAARRRRRPISCRAATASTPCTGACRRSPPAPTWPTAISSTSACRATAIRPRSASASSVTPCGAGST